MNEFEKFYVLKDEISKGSFSIVYKCENKVDKKICAAKIIDLKSISSLEQKKVLNEININGELSHNNIVKFIQFFNDKYIYILILEYIAGGELFDVILKCKYLSEFRVNSFVKQILHAIEYLHSKNIIHRDIKPENILLTLKSPSSSSTSIENEKSESKDHSLLNESEIKISDFGLAIEVKDDIPREYGFAGTTSYMAPEMLNEYPYSKGIDLWSTGIVTYIMLTGEQPFAGENFEQIRLNVRIKRLKFDSPVWKEVSEFAKDFLLKLLEDNPVKRLTAKNALHHPWLKNHKKISVTNLIETVKKLVTFKDEEKTKAATLMNPADKS